MLLRTEIGLDAAGIDALTRHGLQQPQLADRIRGLRESGQITLGVVATDDEGQILGYLAFSPIQVNGEEQHWVVLAAKVIAPDYASTSLSEQLLFEALDSLNEFSYRAAVGYQYTDWLITHGFQRALGLAIDGFTHQDVVVYPLEEQGAGQLSALLTLPSVAATEPTTP